jgi:transcriptional regulator with XRE-family HTH domain
MTGEEFKKIRQKLKLSAATLGHALGYKGRDKNIAVTISRLESGRPIPVTVGRLLEMFDAYGVPRAWAGRQRNENMPHSPNGPVLVVFGQKIVSS